ncbi:hypothetical protein EDB81DRAFT_67651 [Dactylonectria macrodidyma]|uniref:Rhodopsin domain-containing protein n=1 Tax=Dactylonectria macrodidyma TaxID=307937 RepID=A0A9P9EPU3_9HYPO|nr:hypothetical protein EDB81DRAFT_67651 [Dactylonectria macrodidyma]
MALPPHVSLLISCASVCSILILTRCAYRVLCRCKRHPQCHRQWQVDDTYMAFALLPLITRSVLMAWSFSLNPDMTHSPATSQEASNARKTTEELDFDRELALKLLIPVRITYALFLWSLKLCLLTFYSRFVNHLRWGKIATAILWWTIILTFIGVVIATLAECQPMSLSWVIIPDDQRNFCSQGVINLLVMAISNAVTDIALLILPFPVLFQTSLDRKNKLQLSLLFGIGIVVVAITIVRIPLIFMSSVTQSARSLWASVEIVCACIVANAAFFYAIVKDLQSRSHSHDSSNNMQSGEFYMHSLQSSSRPPERRKKSVAPVEQIDLEDSRPPSGNGSANSLWHGEHSQVTEPKL